MSKHKWMIRHKELQSPFTAIAYVDYPSVGDPSPELPTFSFDVEELELSTAVQLQAREVSGLPLLAALQASTLLYRAGRSYTKTAMLVTDGIRFWTSDLKLNGMYTEEITLPILEGEPVWRPVIGDETGWRLA